MSFLLGTRVLPDSVDTVRTVRAADAAGFTFVTIDDAFAGGGPRLSAVDVAAFLGPQTAGIGLLPTVTTTHTEPFHLATSTQTVDLVSCGRGGFLVDVSLDDASAAVVGRRPAPGAGAAWQEAADVVAAVRALWDSWEDDAVIRDAATSRYVDRDRLHYVDATVRGTDEVFSVRGPSIVPRTPQGQPVVAVRLTAGAHRNDPRWPLAVGDAELVIVGATDVDRDLHDTVSAVRAVSGTRVVGSFPAGPTLDLARRLAAWGDELDGAEIVGDVAAAPLVTALSDRGLDVPPPRATFRERLGLSRPADRYAGVAS